MIHLHPAVNLPGAGLWHLVVNQERDRRIVWTLCGIRTAVTEYAPRRDRSGHCGTCFQ